MQYEVFKLYYIKMVTNRIIEIDVKNEGFQVGFIGIRIEFLW